MWSDLMPWSEDAPPPRGPVPRGITGRWRRWLLYRRYLAAFDAERADAGYGVSAAQRALFVVLARRMAGYR